MYRAHHNRPRRVAAYLGFRLPFNRLAWHSFAGFHQARLQSAARSRRFAFSALTDDLNWSGRNGRVSQPSRAMPAFLICCEGHTLPWLAWFGFPLRHNTKSFTRSASAFQRRLAFRCPVGRIDCPVIFCQPHYRCAFAPGPRGALIACRAPTTRITLHPCGEDGLG